MRNTGGTIDFMCDRGDCGKTFVSRNHLKNHVDLHDNNLKKCYFCLWRAPPGESLKFSTHLDQHFDNPRFKCSACGKLFFRKIDLNDHFEAIHEKPDGKYKCKICPYKTCSRHLLYYHLRHNHH